MVEDLYWGPLKVGDWATWFAGFATFLAVCVALGTPWWQAKRAKVEATLLGKRRAQILAIELAEVLLRLRMDMVKGRQILASARRGGYNGAAPNFVRQMTLYGSEGLPSGVDLDGLPYRLAIAIASLKTMLALYNGVVQAIVGLSERLSVQSAIETTKLSNVLDDTQAALARAAKYLGSLDDAYRQTDFYDRGDGTKVEAMPDCDVPADR